MFEMVTLAMSMKRTYMLKFFKNGCPFIKLIKENRINPSQEKKIFLNFCQSSIFNISKNKNKILSLNEHWACKVCYKFSFTTNLKLSRWNSENQLTKRKNQTKQKWNEISKSSSIAILTNIVLKNFWHLNV